MLQNIIDKFLQENVDKRRSEEELQNMREKNRINMDLLNLRNNVPEQRVNPIENNDQLENEFDDNEDESVENGH